MIMAAPDFAAQNIYSERACTEVPQRLAITPSQFNRIAMLAEILTDLLTCFGSFYLSEIIAFNFSSLHDLALDIRGIRVAASFAFLSVILRMFVRDYKRDGGLLQVRETERAIRAALQAALMLQAAGIMLSLRIPIADSAVAVCLTPLLLMVQKHFFFSAVTRLRVKTGGELRVLIYGAGEEGRHLASSLLYSPRLGMRPVAIYEPDLRSFDNLPLMAYKVRTPIPLITGLLTPEVLNRHRADLLLLANRNLSPERTASARDAAKICGTRIATLCTSSSENRCADQIEIDGQVVAFPSERGEGLLYAVGKRTTDIVMSAVLIAVLAPLLIVIAMLIRLDSPGPALFVQKRVGLNGNPFRIFKFRTMYASSPRYERSPLSSADRRITQFGRVLRRTGLDELPQLINVLCGDMSLVGPRPEMPFVVADYTAKQCRRLEVVPGITGLWQLSADRAFPIHQNLYYDLYYIRNRTLALDFAILIHTIVFAMFGGI